MWGYGGEKPPQRVPRSAQCPYSVKNVQEIISTARDSFGIHATLVDLEDSDAVQDSPCPFGTFCILYNDKVISDHPINSTRFGNIMKKIRQMKRCPGCTARPVLRSRLNSQYF